MFYALAQRLVSPCDTMRFGILRWTMRSTFFRHIYLSRANRLLFQHTVACLVYLLLSLKVPVYLLLLGPVVYGVPHLFATARYVPQHLAPKPRAGLSWAILGLSVAGMLAIAWKMAHPGFFLQLRHINLIAMVISFFLFSRLHRRVTAPGFRYIRHVAAAAICGLIYFYPLHSAAALMILHNFVAYVYWLRACRSSRETLVASLSLLLFTGIHVAYFCGALDPYMGWGDPTSLSSSSFGLSLHNVGAQVTAPFSGGMRVFERAAMAYAFGQSLHYVVWLKAIPEHHLRKQIPTAFKESLRLLVRDMGMIFFASAATLMLAYIALNVFMQYARVRELYLLLASYHGYAEIAGLLALRPKEGSN